MEGSFQVFVGVFLCSGSSLLFHHIPGLVTDIMYLFLYVGQSIDLAGHSRSWLTSVKHAPGVLIRNPSSPWRIDEDLFFKVTAQGRTLLVYCLTVASGPR